jgi:uncharacterized linocin/CFP29 family protein
MDTDLNRDKIWDQETWKAIDDAVKDGLQGIRTLQQIVVADLRSDAVNVPADVFNPQKMAMDEAPTKPFVELRVDFSLTPTQLKNEKTLKTAVTLARFAANQLALAEDLVFFQGKHGNLPDTVKTRNLESLASGLLGLDGLKTIDGSGSTTGGDFAGDALFSLVTQGIATLAQDGQPGPYALVLHTNVYANAFSPLPSSLVTAADRLTPILKGGFYPSPSLPENTGLLMSLGGHPTSIYVGQDAIAGYYNQTNQDGSSLFKVIERVQIIARDVRALRRLNFVATKASGKKS